jgi:hypothetical protein
MAGRAGVFGRRDLWSFFDPNDRRVFMPDVLFPRSASQEILAAGRNA